MPTHAYYVYIVKCRNGALYTGTARHIGERVKNHNKGTGAKYTRAFGPVKLVWSRKFKNRSLACKMEAWIKKMTHEQKINFIKGASPRTVSMQDLRFRMTTLRNDD